MIPQRMCGRNRLLVIPAFVDSLMILYVLEICFRIKNLKGRLGDVFWSIFFTILLCTFHTPIATIELNEENEKY